MSEQAVVISTLKWRWADPTAQDHLAHLRDSAGPVVAKRNRQMEDTARGYAWGRIDSPGYAWPAHGGDGLDFSTAFAIHAMGARVYALREAFTIWHETGEIK